MACLKRRVRLALTVATLVSSTACPGPQGGTDVGNGTSVQLSLEAYEAPPMAGMESLLTSTGVELDSVLMAVDRVRFTPSVTCEDPDERFDYDDPIVADLVGAGVFGGAPAFPVEGRSFCYLRVGLRPIDVASAPAGTPDAVDGLSIRVSGTRADGTPFVVESRSSERIELEAVDGAFSLPEGAQSLVLGYEVGSWIEALDLDALPASPIVIDETTDSARLEAFEDAVAQSARLFADMDGDGVVSPAEIVVGAEIAD